MQHGIAVFGANGGGKSTLSHALAKQTGYYEIDVEDYYFPEQKESREWALDNATVIPTAHLGVLPFSVPKAKEEVQSAMLADILEHPKFILSGVTMNWCDEILSHIDMAFWLQTSVEERIRRIQAREEKRFGGRVLPGGDMYEQQLRFHEVVANRDLTAIAESAKRFSCPVVTLDGAAPIGQNVAAILRCL